jgi:hypothetical protein
VIRDRYDTLKSQGLKEERLLLLEAWRDAESATLSASTAANSTSSGGGGASREHLDAVEAKFPRKIKMKRPVFAEDGVTELGSEEYFDYVFPDDEKKMGKKQCTFCCYTAPCLPRLWWCFALEISFALPRNFSVGLYLFSTFLFHACTFALQSA